MKKLFSLAIMAHEERAEWFPSLRDVLGEVPFFIDSGGPGDPGNLGVWGNCRRAWLSYDPEAEWHLVLQDDSILCGDFLRKLAGVLTSLGEQDFALSLYAGERYRAKVAAAVRLKRPYIIGNNILNENALGMRTRHVADMVKYCDLRQATTDRYIQAFCRRRNLLIYSPLPSLVDHRAAPSLYRRLYKKVYPDLIRSAVWFADNEPPSLELGGSLQERRI